MKLRVNALARGGMARWGGQPATTPWKRSHFPGISSWKGSFVARFAQQTQSQAQLDDLYIVALAKQGSSDAYDRIVRRYYGFVRLKASSYFLAGGDSDDLIQEGLVGVYKAVRDFRTDRESSFRNFAELCIT